MSRPDRKGLLEVSIMGLAMVLYLVVGLVLWLLATLAIGVLWVLGRVLRAAGGERE